MLTVIDISSDAAVESSLAAAAFGDQPGRWPLPTASTPQQLWLRAVAAGGQGRYGSARSDLAKLLRVTATGRLASLAHSTQGSFLRQLGWHRLARGWDGRASALAGDHPEAAADALIGLAADALGIGRLAASATLLDRAEPLAKQAGVPRLQVRRSWVAAELAMASGDGDTAVRRAETAIELAVPAGSKRHQTKSEVVLAAALCSAGNIEKARAVGDAALETTANLGLVPLCWAVACLLVDVGSATRTTQQLRDIRDACAQQVRHAGGAWSAG